MVARFKHMGQLIEMRNHNKWNGLNSAVVAIGLEAAFAFGIWIWRLL